MCPDTELLVAYVDGTLYPPDARAIERHLTTCPRCAALLDRIRATKLEQQLPPPKSRPRVVIWGLPLAAVVLIAGWLVAQRVPTTSDDDDAPVPERGQIAAPAITSPPGDAAPSAPADKTPPTISEPPPTLTRQETSVPPEAKLNVAAAPIPRAAPPERAPARDAREDRSRKVNDVAQLRFGDRAIERSEDRGATWHVEYTTDQPIAAMASVSSDVAWVVGAGGLVLRRTQVGWFEASPPEPGADITSVKATSASRATVTLADGRVFRTTNGGVTWSLDEPKR